MFKQYWHPAYIDCLLTLIISSKACSDCCHRKGKRCRTTPTPLYHIRLAR
jgi:hypothetical protein